MNRKNLIEGLLKEGFSDKTLSILNDKQLYTLYKKMVTETKVVIDDPDQLKDIKKDLDPKADSIEVKSPDQQKVELKKAEMGEQNANPGGDVLSAMKQKADAIFVSTYGEQDLDTGVYTVTMYPTTKNVLVTLQGKLANDSRNANFWKALMQAATSLGLKTYRMKSGYMFGVGLQGMMNEGWESKEVAKQHKKVNSSNKKFRAAQTRIDDKYRTMDYNDKVDQRKKDKAKRKEEREAKKKPVAESNIGKFHKPVFKNEKELKEKTEKKVLCDCGKCDICKNKEKSKKSGAKNMAIGLSEKNFVSLAKKGEIMEMIKKKLVEASDPTIAPTKPKTQPTTKPTEKPKPKTPFRPNPGPNTHPKAGGEGLPAFMSFDAIFAKNKKAQAGTTTAPAQPTTKPGTQPLTKPTERPNPKTPFRPSPGPNTHPKAEMNSNKNVKK
jgi:hypothetical protein